MFCKEDVFERDILIGGVKTSINYLINKLNYKFRKIESNILSINVVYSYTMHNDINLRDNAFQFE